MIIALYIITIVNIIFTVYNKKQKDLFLLAC